MRDGVLPEDALARAIASDIQLYNKQKIEEALINDNFFEALSEEITEGRDLFRGRVTPELFRRNYYDRAIVDRVIRASDPDVHGILKELDSDPRYLLLCDAQQCFRARLSPKPWRIGIEMLRERYPFEDEAAEATYHDWQRRYDAAAPRYATCAFVEHLGPQTIDSTLAPLIELHDAMTGVANRLPLA